MTAQPRNRFVFCVVVVESAVKGNQALTINNSAIVIIFNATSKWLWEKSQCGIALTPFIEIVDKELLKYELENVRWRY